MIQFGFSEILLLPRNLGAASKQTVGHHGCASFALAFSRSPL
jgi:hypothetical protein